MITLRCSVVDARNPGAPTDLEVRAPLGATLADTMDELCEAAALSPGCHLTAGGHELVSSQRWGQRPLVDGCLLVAREQATGRRHGPSQAGGLLELHVVGGLDAGRIHQLRPGAHVLGRATSASVTLEDGEVSRAHATIHVTARGLRVDDLRSTNGAWIEGRRLPSEGADLAAGQRVRLGRTTLVVRAPGLQPASTRETGTGTIEVNRPPRPRVEPVDHLLRGRPLPEPRPPTRVPWLTAALPLAVAVPVALLVHQPMFLLFALLSPVMVLASALSDRVGRRRDHRDALADWQVAREETMRRARLVADDDLARRRLDVGDPAGVLAVVQGPSRRVWERGQDAPDLLRLAIGTARLPAAVRIVGGVDGDGGAGGDEVLWHADAPCLVDLVASGHVGVAGPRPYRLALARWLIGQVATWHGPADVALVCLAGDRSAADWRWTRWLPHHVSSTGIDLSRLIRERLQDTTPVDLLGVRGGRSRRVVVVVDGGPEPDPALAEILRDGAACGVHVVWLAERTTALPDECGAVVEVRTDGTARLVADGLAAVDPVTATGAGPGWADRFARAVAPLRDATPHDGAGGLPSSVALADLHDLDVTDPEQVRDAWVEGGRTTAAPVGVGADGVVSIDLLRDGPHALVGGTTGSGKSELLQTLVVSLALRNRPDEMSFVLVDYKGGAAFRAIEDLPHVVGLVTDLDEHLAERALTSLQAEITRRERLLAAADASDLAQYQVCADADPARERLGRLVLVIDEFRVLAQELPSFLTGLVRLAAVGRSLGVHVVLATQRPGGIVSADIKANVNLRIALRVRDRIDSDDVIDCPDAASLPEQTPGRALLRTGASAVTALQVARAGAPASGAAPVETVIRRIEPGGPHQHGSDAAPEPEVLGRIVSAVREAAAHSGVPRPARPWLPPLPDLVDRGTLLPGNRSGDLALGLLDLPSLQTQRTYVWHPVLDSHLCFYGGPRTGRTTALANLALALAEGWSPADVEMHVVDASTGALRPLAGLPHVGTVATRDQPRLISRLVARLAEIVRGRHDGAAPRGRPIVLLIDGWDALVETLEDVDHGRAVDELLALIRDGEAAGLRVAVTGERGVLLSRLASLVSEKLVLRATDPTDLLLAGIPTGVPPTHQPPGRALRAGDGAEIQLAAPGAAAGGRPIAIDASLGPQLERAASRAVARWGADHERATRLVSLPRTVAAQSIRLLRTEGAAASVGPRRGLVGLGGDHAEPVGIDLDVDGAVLVAGPPGSGRSTALRTIAASLHAQGTPVAVLTPRQSTLSDGPWPAYTGDDAQALRRLLAEHPTTCVLVDDSDLLTGTPVEAVLLEVARRRGPAALVVAASTTHALGSFRGLVATVRTARTGVLLLPATPSEGEVLGVRAQLPDAAVPGRGLLVVRGVQRPVQVAR